MDAIITEDSLLEGVLSDDTIDIAELFARNALINLRNAHGQKKISAVISMDPDELCELPSMGLGSLAAFGRILARVGIENKFHQP